MLDCYLVIGEEEREEGGTANYDISLSLGSREYHPEDQTTAVPGAAEL